MAEIKFLKHMDVTPRVNTSVFQFETPRLSEKGIIEIAKMFKLKGDRGGLLTKEPRKMTYTEGPLVVEVYAASGAIRYYDSHRWQVDDGKSNVEMADQDAFKIATKFIKETNVVVPADWSLLKVTRLHVGAMQKGARKAEERVIDLGVVLQQMVNKIPVEGPGGKVVVYIDHQGQVTGCDRIWRKIGSEVAKIPPALLRSPKFAEEDLLAYWKNLAMETVEVVETRFGYFALGPAESQRYLQPAYISPLRLVSSNGRIVMNSFHVVSAAPKPPVPIMPPPKPPIQQRPRKK